MWPGTSGSQARELTLVLWTEDISCQSSHVHQHKIAFQRDDRGRFFLLHVFNLTGFDLSQFLVAFAFLSVGKVTASAGEWFSHLKIRGLEKASD